jgi:hypothetical protein
MVGGEAFAQGLDDRNTTGYGRFEGDNDTALLRRGENLVAVQSNQRLVGSHHMLAVLDGLQHQILGDCVATNQFDHDIDVRIIDNGKRIIRHFARTRSHLTRQFEITVGYLHNLNGTTGATADLHLIALQHGECTTAYSTDS